MKKSHTNKMHHIQRKPSNETLVSVGMDSTLDSRMSSTEVPQMELLKVNYVHQCKEALMTKTGSKPNYSYMEYKRSLPPVQLIPSQHQQQLRGKNVARITVVNRYEAPNKPLPPLPPPTVESWQFLQSTSTPPSQQRTTNSPPKFVKPPASSSSVSVFSDSSTSCCHSSSCDTGCESDSTINGDVEKSNSWDYRNRIATCDIRRDIARAGIKSRADRIARIELTECEHGSPKSKEAVAKINKMFEQQKQSSRQLPPQPSRPAPVPQKEPNRRLKPLAPQPENQDRFRQSLSIKSSEECLECLSQQESEQEGSKRSQDSHKFVARKPISRIPKPIQESRSSASHNRQEAFRYVDNEKTSVAETPPPPLNIDQNLLRNTRLPAGQYQKAKVERVHIRKKRQPLLIINQLNEPDDKRPEKAVEERDKNTCGYKNCNFSNCPMSRSQHDLTHLQHEEDQLKRLSLESNSDSGVSSSNDEHKKPLSSTTSSPTSSKVDNLKNLEKCSDIKKASEHFPPDTYAYDKYKLPKDYEDPPKGSHITIQVGKTSITSFSGHYNTANDPNDVTNFSKKNLTKATPNEALNNSITKSLTSINSMGAKAIATKQCNIENEQRLKIQNNLQNNKSEKNLTKIKIDDDWIMDTSGEHHHHNQDEDFIEADSLMINEQMSPTAAAGGLKKPLNTGDNSVKIFVRSSGQNAHDLTRSSCISAHSFVSQTSVCTQNSTAHSTCSSSSCCSSASSASSSSSSGCSAGSHGGDNQSICDSERDCCCQFPDSNGIFFQRPSSVLSDDQRACAGSPLSSTDAISDISSCVTCSSAQSTVVVAPNANNSKQLACCQADSGVFWNNSYGCLEDGRQADEENDDLPCYCSMSSCDEDNCSYYEGEAGNNRRDENQLQQHHHKGDNIKIEIKNSYRQEEEEEKQVNANLRNPNTNRHQLQQLQHQSNSSTATPPQLPKRNARMSTGNQLLRKTDVIHELRPRSMDCAMDSGVSLNGDNGCNSDAGESQQDMEARRLKRGHVLTELLETERIYVSEMSSILKGYCDQMHSEEMMHLVPASLQGKEDILFGNLHELYTFHNDVFLKDLENCISTTELVALCFVQRRDTFYRLYSFYCQNIPRSDRLRETLVDTHLFLQECQKRLGHKLPLAAYLLKPVQRITKYQLLLKDLLRFSDNGSCTKELQKALDCMLIVLKCVNDSMHQVAITGFPTDLSQQGELLLQDSFQVWSESKKDIRLRIKPQQRHIFLYQKSMLFCKQTSKPGHNKSTYQFKHYLKMSQIGLTESVRGDTKRFEVWLQGRQEVHTLQAPTLEIKNKWVAEIKKVLLTQLEELKGEKIKQYGLNHRGLRQTTSWDTPNILLGGPGRTISCDASSESSNRNSNCSSSDDNCATISLGSGNSGSGSGIGMMAPCSNISLISGITANSISSNTTAASATTDKEHNNEACGWSSDYSNSEDEMSTADDNSSTPRFINFLAPWSTTTSTTTSTSNSTTTPHNGHHHNSNNHHNQNHNHHHHHHNNHNQQLDNGSSYPRNTTNANKSNSKFYVSVEH